jgi:hypothetical protein
MAVTLARLDAADEHCRYVAGDPDGPGWYPLDAVARDPGLVDAWYGRVLEGEAQGRRDVAGSYLASWLGGIVAETVVAALTSEHRAWPVDATLLAVHHHDDGWFDGIAVRASSLRVLPGDPDAGADHVEVVGGADALRALLADDLVAVVAPVFTAIRRRAPFGIRGMWGNLADGVVSSVAWRAWRAGDDVPAALDEAQALVDALAARAPARILPPRLERVDWSGGTAWFPVKTTCCLYYKTFHGTPDRGGEGYCTSCPFREDAWRRSYWASWLDERTAQRGGDPA